MTKDCAASCSHWADEVDKVADELAAEVVRLRRLAEHLRAAVAGTRESVECIELAELVLYDEPIKFPLESRPLPTRTVLA